MEGPLAKALLYVVAPCLAVLVIVVGVIWWDRGAPPGFRPDAVAVSVEEITRDHRGVHVSGTAHYAVRLTQRPVDPEDPTYHLFPMFPKGDTTGRDIRLLVRTTRAPDELLGFEDLTVEGLARPPGRMVPRSAEEALRQQGYDFDEKYVLVEVWDD